MSNEIKVFENVEFGKVKIVVIDGKEWFVAKEVAKILGYKTLQKMYQRLEKDEQIDINPQSIEYQGLCHNGTMLEENKNTFKMKLIDESGLYNAIFGSELPNAKKFRRWVTSEVLPTIRKTGGFVLKCLKEILHDYWMNGKILYLNKILKIIY